MLKRLLINIEGAVQGVGARPFIFRLANRLGITGAVCNDTTGVRIEIQGSSDRTAEFINQLNCAPDRPPLFKITSIKTIDIETDPNEKTFQITSSDSEGVPLSQVTVDTAVCADCLAEMNDKNDFRFRYPFINCTNCGPRYSILKTIPYDRPNTTMADFKMCPRCQSQYTEPADRRFHAQPVACPSCGPKITLTDNTGKTIESDSDSVIKTAARLLREGKVVAIKGIGGFHLAVDAFNEQAVQTLRQRKHRDHKPFAIMAASVDTIRNFADVSVLHEQLLKSPQAPIVLVPKKDSNSGRKIVPSVAAGTSALGFMLCYAPLHYLLFRESGIEILVMTSGNLSDEPLICDNAEALEKLGHVADAFLMHNRDIYRRLDDSVMHIINKKPSPLRRARGYVPTPIRLETPAAVAILAAGADMKNTFCFVKCNQLILSEHIGDLSDALVYRHYKHSIEHLAGLFDVKPEAVVCDLHPGYFSTQFARSLKPKKLLAVQHHWAHVAAVLAEFNHPGPVIGLVADGTGYGTDGAIWGCECLIASLRSFERFGHLKYYTLPGGDKASREPIRPLLGLLACYKDSIDVNAFDKILKTIEPDDAKLNIIKTQLEKNINTVPASSLGRLFDAVAAILELGAYNHFDAQLPMALEAIAEKSIEQSYDFALIKLQAGMNVLDFHGLLQAVVKDKFDGLSAAVISGKFHNTIAAALFALAVEAKKAAGIDTVALSGGCFCNVFLANRLIEFLKNSGFNVLFSTELPVNDGCIALGQAAIAASLVF